MQFVVIGHDGKDTGAQERRQIARAAHLTLCDGMKARGELLYAAALLGPDGNMTGSVLVVQMENRDKVDTWLAHEPYVVGRVWERIEVTSCRVAPSFVATSQTKST